jgi:uncharacterized protein
VTSPENPFAGSEIPRVPHDNDANPPTLEDLFAGIEEPFPSWGMLDLLTVTFIALGAIFGTTLLALMVAPGLPAFRDLGTAEILTDPRVIVPAQTVAYGIVFFFIYRIIAGYKHLSFGETIHWRWPALRSVGYLLIGIALAIVVVLLERVLPMPKDTPFDKLFRTTGGAWMMSFLGIAIAPFMEELYFRGLLFPVLARSINLLASITLTSFLFALLHASQLGHAWAPVTVLFLVGVVLTVVRWWTKSLAASVIVHVAYNATLFSFIYASSDGFHHLDKLSR